MAPQTLLSDRSVFRSAVDAVPTGMVVTDESGTILYANSWIERICRYRSSEVVGRSLQELIPAAAASHLGLAVHDQQASTSGSTGGGRGVLARRRDGTDLPVEIGWKLEEHAGQRLLLVSIIDITDRHGLQASLQPVSARHGSFERLLTDLAARFLAVRAGGFRDAVIDSLRQIAEWLDLDRSTWWQVPHGDSDAVVTYTWNRSEYRLMPSAESAQVHIPWLFSRLREGQTITFTDVRELPSEADRAAVRRFGARSGAAIPFMINNEFRAILGFSSIRRTCQWPPDVVDRLRLVTAVLGQALIRKETDDQLRSALSEVRQLREHLSGENVQLRREQKPLRAPRLMSVESPAITRVLDAIESVAPTPATVLLLGETGTGKEVFAQAIHRASDRRGRAMVTVNCGAIPSTLIESELFGRERGAFTGALARQIGRFEMAHESTLFLDEIGELPLEAQVKLLRVIQERVIERLGGGPSVKINVRIIAATNRNLEKAVQDRTFREDLYYRLNVFPIAIPPLRDRFEDILPLVWTFIEEYSAAFHKPIESISKESLAALTHHSWPGNVRELRNVIERAVIVAKGSELVVDIPAVAAPPPVAGRSTRLHDLEVEQIRAVLERVGGRVRGPGGAAELLGIKPNTLDSRMARLGIRRRPGAHAS